MLNMNYSSEILSNVRDVLSTIKERGGLVSSKFLTAEAERLQGQWAADTLNIALGAMGKGTAFEGKATEAQLSALVERARKEHGDLLSQIATMRAEKGKSQGETPRK